MRYLLIVNPVSGGGGNPRRLARALRYFRRRGDQVILHKTKAPGDGTRVVLERCRHGFDAVIAAGGDGTIHEVLEGLAGTGVPLGILPWGTGNVFAREMRIPRGTRAQCRVIRQGKARILDLGLADSHPFLLMASIGLDAFALGTLGPRLKRLWGWGAYALGALVALVRYRQRDIEVRLDNGTVDRGGFVLISNTRLYGNWFVFHPQANPSDGFLDVLVFRDVGRWPYLGLVFQMVSRSLLSPRSSRPPAFLALHGVYRVRGLSVLAGHCRSVQVDGDLLPGGAVEFAVSPGALTVLLPH